MPIIVYKNTNCYGMSLQSGERDPGSQSLEGLCENINKVYTTSNEFSRCKIPQAIEDKSKPRLLNIIN